jgi:pimeloyl-ACP methyl ester carboxylesterase
VPLLERRGIAALTVDLPSVGADPAEPPGLLDDAAAVTALLDAHAGPFVLCGHSYGGMVVTAASAGRMDVARLVYLCAFMPDVGESLLVLTGGPAPWIEVHADGRALPDLAWVAAVGYADCDDETRAAAVARLRPQVTAPFVEAVPAAGWHEIPATYVVCTEDESLPVELQRGVFAPRAETTVELVSSHAPHFSRPEELAQLLAESARRGVDG